MSGVRTRKLARKKTGTSPFQDQVSLVGTMVKKATKNGVPPNLGDSWPSRGGPVQRPDTASESAGESWKDRKEN